MFCCSINHFGFASTCSLNDSCYETKGLGLISLYAFGSVVSEQNCCGLIPPSMNIFRYFNVIGSDPEGRLGEAPRPELREHGRISGACFDAARGITPGLKVCY